MEILPDATFAFICCCTPLPKIEISAAKAQPYYRNCILNWSISLSVHMAVAWRIRISDSARSPALHHLNKNLINTKPHRSNLLRGIAMYIVIMSKTCWKHTPPKSISLEPRVTIRSRHVSGRHPMSPDKVRLSHSSSVYPDRSHLA